MFTGIVRKLGTVVSNKGAYLRVRGVTFGRLPKGASVAINGTCLTAIRQQDGTVDFDVSPETLRLTNLGGLKAGARVNLEPSLKAADFIGGHWVSGHVDSRAKVLEKEKVPGGFVRMRFSLPKALRKFVALKGSIAVDGTSLTVTKVGKDHFESVLIPETLDRTTLGIYRPGGVVNLEVDLFARYIVNILDQRKGK
ncbi:MAG: riboflavin synthase [Elusimicrobiota bacterium]